MVSANEEPNPVQDVVELEEEVPGLEARVQSYVLNARFLLTSA